MGALRLVSAPPVPLRVARVAALCALGAACAAGESPVGDPQGAGVRFVAVVDASQFAPGSSLRVEIWNGEKLAALEQNARCASVHDPTTGSTRRQCPPGVTYQEVAPEGLQLAVSEIGASLSVRSETVQVGDRFRILLSGPSADGCNRTSAEERGEAAGKEIVLDGLAWTTTAKGCLSP